MSAMDNPPALETIACPFCGDGGTSLLRQDGWEAKRCPYCHLVFVSPRPVAEAVAAIYRRGESHNPPERHLAKNRTFAARADARFALRHIAKHSEIGRLLEVGPGGGALLAEARTGGWQVAGVELNPRQAAFIRNELGIECVETFDEVSLLGRFDVVYHKDVLSHLPDPVATFSKLRQALKPGGIMVFETGNGDYDLRYAPLIKSFEFPDHLFFFSESALDKLLVATGFAVVGRTRYGTTVQLRIDRVMRTLFSRGHVATEDQKPATHEGGPVWEALEFLRHVVRYRVGRVLPTRNRPFTMLTIARCDGE